MSLTSVRAAVAACRAAVASAAPGAPITVLLYPKQAFRDVTQAAENVVGLFDGKIRIPLGGLSRIDPQVERTLAHELTHAIVQAKTRGNCPRWLHEGLAQLAEGRKPSAADRAAVTKLLRQHDPESWHESGFSYPAALSLTIRLESIRGETGLAELLDKLEDGNDIDSALQATFGMTYAELCRDWASVAGAGTELR